MSLGDLAKHILADILADFRARNLGSYVLIEGYSSPHPGKSALRHSQDPAVRFLISKDFDYFGTML
jgi:hypothetical protein